jgi:hypothetical protein
MLRSIHFLVGVTLALALSFALCLPTSQAAMEGGLDPADPMVRITSGKIALNVASIMKQVGEDVGNSTGLGPNLVTYYWQTFDAISLNGQPSTDKPLFVDLYVPCFMDQTTVEKVLNALADSLAVHAKIEKRWIFIHTHFPKENQVYIDGKVMQGCKAPTKELR